MQGRRRSHRAATESRKRLIFLNLWPRPGPLATACRRRRAAPIAPAQWLLERGGTMPRAGADGKERGRGPVGGVETVVRGSRPERLRDAYALRVPPKSRKGQSGVSSALLAASWRGRPRIAMRSHSRRQGDQASGGLDPGHDACGVGLSVGRWPWRGACLAVRCTGDFVDGGTDSGLPPDEGKRVERVGLVSYPRCFALLQAKGGRLFVGPHGAGLFVLRLKDGTLILNLCRDGRGGVVADSDRGLWPCSGEGECHADEPARDLPFDRGLSAWRSWLCERGSTAHSDPLGRHHGSSRSRSS